MLTLEKIRQLSDTTESRGNALIQALAPIVDPLDAKLIAILAAEGMGAPDIADRLGVDEAKVLQMLNRPDTTRMIFKFQSVLRMTPEQQIENALPRAVEKKIWLMMHSQDERIQSTASTEIIDRARGKPIQTTMIGKLNGGEDIKAVDSNLQALQDRLSALEGQKKQLLESRGAVIDVDPNDISD